MMNLLKILENNPNKKERWKWLWIKSLVCGRKLNLFLFSIKTQIFTYLNLMKIKQRLWKITKYKHQLTKQVNLLVTLKITLIIGLNPWVQ